jgi:hypothetical protein
MSSPDSTAHNGWGPFAVFRRAKNVKNASDAERTALSDDAERIENWAARLVLAAIALEAAIWILPLCQPLFKLGNFIADAAVAVGIYAETRFGHVMASVLKIRLAEAIERAANAELATEKLRKENAWRTIGNAERGAIMESINASGAPGSIRFTVMANDPESLHFAQQIGGVFQFSGWHVGYSFESFNVGIMTGILLPFEKDHVAFRWLRFLGQISWWAKWICQPC